MSSHGLRLWLWALVLVALLGSSAAASVEEVTSEAQFKKILSDYPAVVVDFYSQTCGPCIMMAPIYKEVAKEYDGRLKLIKVDVQRAHVGVQIRSMPTFHFYLQVRRAARPPSPVRRRRRRSRRPSAVAPLASAATLLTRTAAPSPAPHPPALPPWPHWPVLTPPRPPPMPFSPRRPGLSRAPAATPGGPAPAFPFCPAHPRLPRSHTAKAPFFLASKSILTSLTLLFWPPPTPASHPTHPSAPHPPCWAGQAGAPVLGRRRAWAPAAVVTAG